jgi:hypothetical protein
MIVYSYPQSHTAGTPDFSCFIHQGDIFGPGGFLFSFVQSKSLARIMRKEQQEQQQ